MLRTYHWGCCCYYCSIKRKENKNYVVVCRSIKKSLIFFISVLFGICRVYSSTEISPYPSCSLPTLSLLLLLLLSLEVLLMLIVSWIPSKIDDSMPNTPISAPVPPEHPKCCPLEDSAIFHLLGDELIKFYTFSLGRW